MASNCCLRCCARHYTGPSCSAKVRGERGLVAGFFFPWCFFLDKTRGPTQISFLYKNPPSDNSEWKLFLSFTPSTLISSFEETVNWVLLKLSHSVVAVVPINARECLALKQKICTCHQVPQGSQAPVKCWFSITGNHAVCPMEPWDRRFKRTALLGLEIKGHKCAAKTQFASARLSHGPIAKGFNGKALVRDRAENGNRSLCSLEMSHGGNTTSETSEGFFFKFKDKSEA